MPRIPRDKLKADPIRIGDRGRIIRLKPCCGVWFYSMTGPGWRTIRRTTRTTDLEAAKNMALAHQKEVWSRPRPAATPASARTPNDSVERLMRDFISGGIAPPKFKYVMKEGPDFD